MADETAVRLGAAIREARHQHGWTQDQLAEASGVSRPTVQRCENAKGATRPHVARELFLALDLDPRYLPVLLGYVTAEEMAAPPSAPTYRPTTMEAVALLEDPSVPVLVAKEWVELLQFLAGRRQDHGQG